MATPLQMSISAAAATGASVALTRPCTYLKVTNTAAANTIYVSLRNVNNGDVITAPGADPAPTAGNPSAYVLLTAGKEIEVDALKNILSSADLATGWTGEKVTHILLYSTSGAIVNVIGMN